MPQTTEKTKFVFAQVKGFDEAGVLEAVASTGAIDRQGESIEPEAWKDSLPTYRTNPVILATHMHRLSNGDSPVIGSAVSIEITKDGLVFRMKFAGTDLGKQYEQLYREKHMRAFSVGFYPIDGRWQDYDRDGKGDKRTWVHTKVDLLEISAVPVPANPEALSRMRELMFGNDATGTTELKDSADAVSKSDIENWKSEILDAIAEVRELITLSSDPLGMSAPPPTDAPATDEKARRPDESQGANPNSPLRQAAADLLNAATGNS